MIAEIQARNAVRKLQTLRSEVLLLTTHAKTMAGKGSESFDARDLLEISSSLLQALLHSRLELQQVLAETQTLSRALSSKPPQGGGLSPAAKWVPEFRAGSTHLIAAIGEAEKAVLKLAEASKIRLNAPARTDTGPDNLIEFLTLWIQFLTKWIEAVRQHKT